MGVSFHGLEEFVSLIHKLAYNGSSNNPRHLEHQRRYERLDTGSMVDSYFPEAATEHKKCILGHIKNLCIDTIQTLGVCCVNDYK